VSGRTTEWTERELLAALPLAVPTGASNGASAPAGGAADPTYGSISTDTRTLSEGSLFLALRGENFDGHEFLAEAARQGARAAVVDVIPPDAPPLRYYRVPDTLAALGRLGRHRRRTMGGRVVAITGTTGRRRRRR
jgi:UDP-N-acetylmuramoyl-tripeptide--D-alanyl-D-alanine ligase